MNWIIVDFGSFQLKALKARLDGNKVRIDNFIQWKAQPDYFEGLDFPNSKAWSAVSVGLNEAGWLNEENNILLSHLPSSYLETRYLRFPFRSEKKIEKVLPLEIESTVPFEVEDILLRHRVLKGPGVLESKDAHVLVMGYQRQLIQKYENELRQYQLSIPPISVDLLSLSCLRQALPSIYPLLGILNIGHRKTQWALLQSSGNILAARTFWWGGDNLLQFIEKKMGAQRDQALHLLTTEASFELNSDTRSIDIELAEALEDSLTQFMNEFRQYLKGLQQVGLELPKPLPIYLTGKPSEIPGIAKRLQERFQQEFELQVDPFPLENLMRQIDGLSSLEDPMAALPALSQLLSQTRAHRAKIPIFSESSFQFQQNLKRIRNESVALMRSLGVLLIAPVIFLITSLIIHGKEEKKLESQIRNLLAQNQIRVDEGQSTEEILASLQKEAMEYRKKIKQLSEDDSSPLLVLSDLSRIIPPRIKVDMKEFRVTADKVLLKIETDSIQSKQEIEKLIREVFPSVKSGGVQACTSFEGCQSFSIEMERTSSS